MKRVKLQFYKRSLYLTTDQKELEEHMVGNLPNPLNEYGGVTAEYVDHNKSFSKGVIIYINTESDEHKTIEGLIDTISHESFHAVNFIFHDLGIEYTKKDDEHAAYLLGFIARECMKYVNKG